MPVLTVNQSPVIGIWKIIEPWQDMLELFQNKAMYINDVLKILPDKRKCEWLAIRLLLRHITGTEMIIGYRTNGSPFLQNSHYNISISHTKGYAALILSSHSHPGIDIEYRSERALKLCMKYMSEKELDQLKMSSTLATVCWCAKETVFKALQESEVDFIKHFHVAPFTLSEQGTLFLKETKTLEQTTYPIYYQVTDKFILTWTEGNV